MSVHPQIDAAISMIAARKASADFMMAVFQSGFDRGQAKAAKHALEELLIGNDGAEQKASRILAAHFTQIETNQLLALMTEELATS